MPKTTRWPGAETVAISNAWIPMARARSTRLESRGITAAWLDALTARTVEVEDAIAGKLGAKSTLKSSTAELQVQVGLAADWISVVRSTVKRLYPKNRALLEAFGAGGKSPRVATLPSAVAALDQVLGAVARYPSEASAAAIQQRDVDRLTKLRDDLRRINALQEEAKGSRKQVTASVNSMIQGLIDDLDRLFTAVQLEYAEEKDVIQAFRAVIPTPTPKKIKPAA